jgi:hypothetical protein
MIVLFEATGQESSSHNGKGDHVAENLPRIAISERMTVQGPADFQIRRGYSRRARRTD